MVYLLCIVFYTLYSLDMIMANKRHFFFLVVLEVELRA
jgi:hypothetical protein